MSATRSWGTAVLLSLLALACGAEQKSAPPADAPASAGRSNDSVNQAPPYKSEHLQQQYAPPPPPPAAPTREPGKMPVDTPTERQRSDAAWLELQTARGELDATTGDCALACKALASMDRATSHVCSVAPDEAHCGNARETLKTARRRVRAECMACPNGAPVDPDAPIPSAPP